VKVERTGAHHSKAVIKGKAGKQRVQVHAAAQRDEHCIQCPCGNVHILHLVRGSESGSTHTSRQHACTVGCKLLVPGSSTSSISRGCTLNRRKSWNMLASLMHNLSPCSVSFVKDTCMCSNCAADQCRCLSSTPLTCLTHTSCTRVCKAQSAKPSARSEHGTAPKHFRIWADPAFHP